VASECLSAAVRRDKPSRRSEEAVFFKSFVLVVVFADWSGKGGQGNAGSPDV